MKYSLCVSGAAGGPVVEQSRDKAYQLGVAIARAGQILTTGATIGLPFFAAQGAKDRGGLSIGFSPAASLREHIRKYGLPTGVFDYINFTGQHYVGRDIQLVTGSDALICVGGRTGSLHEFMVALEAGIPAGVLTGSGGAADLIPEVIDRLGPPKDRHIIVFDPDPDRLVDKVLELLATEHSDLTEAELAAHEESFRDLAHRISGSPEPPADSGPAPEPATAG